MDKRYLPGIKKFGKCLISNYIKEKEGKIIYEDKASPGKLLKVYPANVLMYYMIDCQKQRCRQRYIGVTKDHFRKE